ncbi:glycosyltransferase family 39 protein [Halovivax sp.]|uniref:ArnT family glycosyltransferase n=1 Tax=Halovivax sp. TaxID=1935978 RepID=UPI0025BBEF50|nr:glycosyltransferase family 39 protein [Halovivax sp.]
MSTTVRNPRLDRTLDAARLLAAVATGAVALYAAAVAGFADEPVASARPFGFLGAATLLAYANLFLVTTDRPARAVRAAGRVLVVGTVVLACVLPWTESFAGYAGWTLLAGLSFVGSLYVRRELREEPVFLVPSWERISRGPVTAYTVGLALATAWGAFLIFDGLGAHSFFHDEQWHAEVAMSVLETGEFARWNFVAEEPGEAYRRGYLVNAVGAGLAALFGYDEFTLRAFPAAIGVATIPLVYLFVRRFTSRDVALAVTVAVVSNVVVIFFSRFLRPYTVFVFAYLATLYLFDVAVDELRLARYRRAGLALLATAAALGVAMQAAQFAKIALALLPLAAVVYLAFDPELRRSVRAAPKAAAALVVAFLAALVVLGAPGELQALPRQTTEFLSLSRVDRPTTTYVHYLFERYVKFEAAFVGLFVAGAGALAVIAGRERDPKPLVFLLYALVPLIVMSYLFDHFTDPRYVFYVIPFVFGVAMVPLALAVRVATDVVAMPSARAPLIVLLVASLVVFPLSPIAAPGDGGYAMQAPAEWEHEDASQLLHERAAPPDYRTAYGCVNEVVEPGDVVISTGRFETAYVDPQPGVEYYQLPWNDRGATDLRTGEVEPFFDVVEDEDVENVYVVSTYVHMVDGEVVDWLLAETDDLSAEIGIEPFYYSGLHAEHDLRWPSVRHAGQQAPDVGACG